jgi:hypothetical protein
MQKTKNRFGNHVLTTLHDLENSMFEKEITLGGDNNHYYFDYEQQTKHLTDLTSVIKGEKEFKSPLDINLPHNCHANKTKPYFPDNKHAEWAFAPVFTGNIKPSAAKIEIEGNCFEETTFELMYDEATPSEY